MSNLVDKREDQLLFPARLNQFTYHDVTFPLCIAKMQLYAHKHTFLFYRQQQKQTDELLVALRLIRNVRCVVITERRFLRPQVVEAKSPRLKEM